MLFNLQIPLQAFIQTSHYAKNEEQKSAATLREFADSQGVTPLQATHCTALITALASPQRLDPAFALRLFAKLNQISTSAVHELGLGQADQAPCCDPAVEAAAVEAE